MCALVRVRGVLVFLGEVTKHHDVMSTFFITGVYGTVENWSFIVE